MPRVALLADVHGNFHALVAVLREVAEADVIGIGWGGDLVGYGADSDKCVRLARELHGQGVMGNHELYTRQVSELGLSQLPDGWKANTVWAGVAHALKTLPKEDLNWLTELPWVYHLKGAILAHASLHEPSDWPYLYDDASALPTLEILRDTELGIGFFGHTHCQQYFAAPGGWDLPAVEELGDGNIHVPEGAACAVMMGSVGQSRDPDDLRAAWVVWDSDARVVEFRRTAYDHHGAAAILDAGLPPASAARLLPEVVAAPPDPAPEPAPEPELARPE